MDSLNTNLQGRIIALELMMRGFMTKMAMENSRTPVEFLEQWQNEMLGSLQMMSRPTDEYADEVWAEAATALNMLFSETIKRVANLSE